ncbi:MAG: laccase domain-containing protein [Pseudomonadota bacterium]
MPSAPIHFFATRKHGVDFSVSNTGWRYGKGNVFSPAPNHPENKNAETNVQSIPEEYKIENDHPGVILQSRYGKGISEVSHEFLEDATHERDSTGHIVINGDGLFTTMTNVPLLNKSGDAPAIIFEAEQAIGIIVGAWRCLGKDIINLMLDKFTDLNVNFDQITVFIGPGLGKGSFTLGQAEITILKSVFDNTLDEAVALKPPKPEKPPKFYIDVVKLMELYAKSFGFTVNSSEHQDTFNKEPWREMKRTALANNDPISPINYYKNQMYFSARMYVRADRLARRIAKKTNSPLPETLAVIPDTTNYEDLSKASSRYAETGRCLNGVMRKNG